MVLSAFFFDVHLLIFLFSGLYTIGESSSKMLILNGGSMSRGLIIGVLLLFHVPAAAVHVQIGQNGEFLVDGEPFFPIMQWMQSAFRIRTQARYGINLFCVPGNSSATPKSWCDSAAANNVYACYSYKPEHVASVKDHPALFGWFFGDEPDLAGHEIFPDSIKRQYEAIKVADPNHPTFLTLTSRFYSEHNLPTWMNGKDSLYYEYPKFTDVIGFDLYPVYGWCRPDWIYQVGDAVSELRFKYMRENKPVYAWIECGKTSSKWCENSTRGEDDGPYVHEIEAQVWLAIIHGAKGIGYFTHSWECPDYTQWCVSDEQVQALTRINSQITALTRVLCAPDAPGGVTVTATGVNGGNGRIDACARVHEDSVYIIAAHVINKTGAAKTQQGAIKVSGVEGVVTVYGEDRTIALSSDGTFTDTFTTEEPVRIYALKRSLTTPVKTTIGGPQKQKQSPKLLIPVKRVPVGPVMDLKGARVRGEIENRAVQPIIMK